jgi:hypothetical protein
MKKFEVHNLIGPSLYLKDIERMTTRFFCYLYTPEWGLSRNFSINFSIIAKSFRTIYRQCFYYYLEPVCKYSRVYMQYRYQCCWSLLVWMWILIRIQHFRTMQSRSGWSVLDPYTYWECGSGSRRSSEHGNLSKFTNKPGFLPFKKELVLS